MENEINIRSNSKPLLQSSSRFTKNIRDGIVIYGPALIAYQSLIDRWSSTETKSNPNTTSKENEFQPIETSKENDHDLLIKKLKSYHPNSKRRNKHA